MFSQELVHNLGQRTTAALEQEGRLKVDASKNKKKRVVKKKIKEYYK